MDIKELNWLRANLHKLDKNMRAEILGHYRSLSRVPCFLQKMYQWYRERFRKFPVIVQNSPLRNGGDALEVLMKAKKSKNVHNLKLVNGCAARLTLQEIQSIAPHPSVKKIYLDREIRALLNNAVTTVKADMLWHKGYAGEGVTVAILDSGIYPHPDLVQPTNRILAFLDFLKPELSTPYDDNGHGTHCAAAATGNGFSSAGKYAGPASKANLVALKVLDKQGSGKTSQAIQALEWCLENKNKYNIRVISLSLGYKASESYRDDLFCQAVGKVWEEGIVVCTAAGNEGPEERTVYSPGIHPDIITVGASNDKGTPDSADDEVADFSSRGPTPDGLTKPDVLVPGNEIISARAKGSYLDKTMDNSVIEEWYLALSGTSMATPICAGIAAQLLEADPTLTPPEIKEILTKSCFKITSADANSQGSGCIDALSAFTLLKARFSANEEEPA